MHARTHAVTDSTTECKKASEVVAKERRGVDKRDGEAIKKGAAGHKKVRKKSRQEATGGQESVRVGRGVEESGWGAEIKGVVVGDRRGWSPLTLQQNGQLAGDANSAL